MSGLGELFRKVVDCLMCGRLPQAFSTGSPDGVRAERLAEAYLRKRGGRILARNYRCRGGELDLVVLYEGQVLFVEVRLRQRSDFGGALASITPTKQRRLIRAARHWLAGAGQAYARYPCRFDAVALDGLDETRIEWLQGAFNANGT